MALHFKGNSKILLGDDVFLNVTKVNGKGMISLCKARRIPSLDYPHRTVNIPGPYSVALTYKQYIELVDKAPLLTSVFKSMHEDDVSHNPDVSHSTPKRKDNYISQKRSKRHYPENKKSLPTSQRRCSLITLTTTTTTKKPSVDGESDSRKNTPSSTLPEPAQPRPPRTQSSA